VPISARGYVRTWSINDQHCLKVPVWWLLCILADAANISIEFPGSLVRAVAESCESTAFSEPWAMSGVGRLHEPMPGLGIQSFMCDSTVGGK
jgi:hypothetical protein